jgi:transposase-like protein
MACPKCGSTHVKKNGSIHNKKQKYQCNSCGRQFVENPQNKVIGDETKNLIDNLLLEKIPLAGIARIVGVSEPWLQNYVNEKYADVPQVVDITEKIRGGLRFNVMKCGLLLGIKIINSGFGWQ